MDWLRQANWLNKRRLRDYPRIFFLCYIVVGVFWIHLSHNFVDIKGKPIGTDFLDFYSASVQSLKGQPSHVYNPKQQSFYEHAIIPKMDKTSFWPFLYPPTYLLLILPLALLSYGWSLIVFMMSTLWASWVVLKRLAPQSPETSLLILAFPAVFITLGHGQNAFLTTALLGGALLLLDLYPCTAGFLFGLMAYKPQYVWIIPIILVVSKRWSVFVAMLITITLLIGVSYIMFGQATWKAFFDSAEISRQYLELGAMGWEKYESIFATVRMLGGSIPLAYIIQGIMIVCVLVVLIWLWSDPSKKVMAQAALPLGIMLATPHILDYDLMLLSIPIALLSREALRTSFLPWEKNILILAWLVPLIARAVTGFKIPIGLMVIILFFCFIVRRSKQFCS